jgi:hypothetical protein
MTDPETLYDLLASIRTSSQEASRLTGKLMTQNDVDCVDRIGDLANNLIGRLIGVTEKRRKIEASKGAEI